MGSAIGQILGNAVGVAISPVPIIAVILMLFSAAARRNGIAFAIGWVVGLGGAGAVVLASGLTSSGGDPAAGGWGKVVIGALFMLLGVKQWRGRPAPGVEAPLPGWMAAVDEFSAAKAFGMAVLLAAVNPKNLGLTIAAAASIGAAGISSGQEYVVLAVYVLIAASTILVPVIGFVVLGDRLVPTLTSMKLWLSSNNATVMTVLFLVLGAKVLGDGLTIVAS